MTVFCLVALVSEIKGLEVCAQSCKATTTEGFNCSASDMSATERSILPVGFHEVIHFSSHTLTFIPNTLLMSAGGGGVDEVRDWHGIK